MKTLEDRQRECAELYKSGYPAKATPAATVRNDKAEAFRRMKEVHAAGGTSGVPATWPPDPSLPQATRLHVQSDGLLEVLLKRNGKGKRPWRVVGTRGTFLQHPAVEAIDRAEAAFLKELKSLEYEGFRKHAVAKKSGAGMKKKVQSMHDTIAFTAGTLSAKFKNGKLTTAVFERLKREEKPPSRRTVARVLKALGKVK
jgi:hypothetical protein